MGYSVNPSDEELQLIQYTEKKLALCFDTLLCNIYVCNTLGSENCLDCVT